MNLFLITLLNTLKDIKATGAERALANQLHSDGRFHQGKNFITSAKNAAQMLEEQFGIPASQVNPQLSIKDFIDDVRTRKGPRMANEVERVIYFGRGPREGD